MIDQGTDWVRFALITGLALATGCTATVDGSGVQVERQRSESLTGGGESADAAQHCDAGDARHEESAYDTSGDDIPDVRKVFLRVGNDDLSRLVLVCRESDLNSDGVKDVVRFYSDEGAPQREEADRNFDGRMDEITYFQEAKVVRREFDTNADGRVDLKVYYKDGEPLRAERDIGGRSTAGKWQPDRWEYYEDDRVVRMGTDLDGDGTVDRWDRDETLERDRGIMRSDETVMSEEGETGGEADEG